MQCPIFLAFSLLVLFPFQDPERPKPPKKAARLGPIQEPGRTPVERRDLLQRFRARSRLEGTFKLVVWQSAAGTRTQGVVGYVVIGQQYLSIHLQGPGSRAKTPMLQAGFRSYRVQGDKLFMTNLVGHRNKASGDVFVEPAGRTETRRFTLAGTVLRIHQSGREYMEFVRVE